MSKTLTAMDGNTAAAHVAHATNEVIAIYPITPSSVMGEIADIKSARGEKNIWGTVPTVIEMQSEGGASGAVHGALTAGALTTTFTASQGLLLMIPNMYKIAGELTSTVFHVSARALAAHALSIFGDHGDVMACRQTGWALLASANPQEAMDFALIAQAAALKTRVPFLHFFDGFRTSHELNMVEALSPEVMRGMVSEKLIAEHKARGLSPEHPVLRGTAQNPDVFFQSREACNKFYDAVPTMVKEAMGQFEKLTGRKYGLFDYVGAPDADKVVVIMASGCDTVEDTVNHLVKTGAKVGLLKVRLYRPYSEADFIKALPKTVKSIAVLDRTKEPGSLGEPLFQDVVTACAGAFKAGRLKELPAVIGGRYGLGSKEFTPAMARAVIENLDAAKPIRGFTVGIKDDVTNLSLDYDENWTTEPADIFRALFFGLGSDGTVGANKNTIKIISEETGQFAQGYFVYDSKKAGSMTVSHVRFGRSYIRAPYLVYKARFIGCHQFSFLEKYEMLDKAEDKAVFLINSPFDAGEVWDRLPVEVQENIIKKHLKVHVVNASRIAEATGMGARINVIMQTAFFGISGVLPKDEAISAIKESIRKTYASKGDEVVNKNFAAVDQTLAAIQEVKIPAKATSKTVRACKVEGFPPFVRDVLCEMTAFRGDQLPVSALPVDGTFPVGTARFEKRNIALEAPVWEKHLCIQCGFCALVCPHAAIRIKAYDAAELAKAPATFKSDEGKGDLKGHRFTVQVAIEDCTGCGACVYNCPGKEKKEGKETGVKAINLRPQLPLRET
ncbi:MAG: pyruvate:ferredoxin (flavodoxin) oxidoreductase, partial [Elusimicrobia bacterium]|nr:pyruvate:ferredoxin (flavodoxin) oxidoreductase [Elusimicrobiota bacterium]